MGLDALEQAAFVAQITRHQSMLRSYIISLMPGVEGVDDVLQQTNLVLWEKRASFQAGTNFRSWAATIARYEVKTHRRKMLRYSKLMLSEDLSEMLEQHIEAPPDELEERLQALDHCFGCPSCVSATARRVPTSFLPLSEPHFSPSCTPTPKSNFLAVAYPATGMTDNLGFRLAAVPEPSACVVALLFGAGLLTRRARR